ncbi:MAG: hypothetical protein ACK52I_07480 [Pseudomonadota bacterium]
MLSFAIAKLPVGPVAGGEAVQEVERELLAEVAPAGDDVDGAEAGAPLEVRGQRPRLHLVAERQLALRADDEPAQGRRPRAARPRRGSRCSSARRAAGRRRRPT